MITIIYSTHKDSDYNQKFRQHLSNTVGVKDVQILEYQNNNQYSLSEVYNKGISESIYDIIVCCHNDIKLEKNWGKKLIEDFDNNPNFGIIGKAGSCYFSDNGIFWDKMSTTMVGQVYHHPPGQKKWLSRYCPKLPFLIPVVTIDGLFMSFNKTKIKHKYDEDFKGFHFYDHGFCLPNYLDDVKIGVTSSFEITHESIGKPNEEFFKTRELFVEKYKSVLPLDLKPPKIYAPEVKETEIKKVGKVAVIIPTKGKVNILLDCVDSFIDHCNPNLFDIFIADTGSTDEEKETIKNHIKDLSNVTLIEYDYYNFAKINNQVVKEHVDDKYEFILFCNNDIKIMNNIIFKMIKNFKDKPKMGTLGCRLHFMDNTVQHDGVTGVMDKGKFVVFHEGMKGYYIYGTGLKQVFGNTAALMGIRKNVFEKCGMFNENYVSCYEDTELNIKLLCMGYENYVDSTMVAYHYESLTREKTDDSFKLQQQDFLNNLKPFVFENLKKIENKLRYVH